MDPNWQRHVRRPSSDRAPDHTIGWALVLLLGAGICISLLVSAKYERSVVAGVMWRALPFGFLPLVLLGRTWLPSWGRIVPFGMGALTTLALSMVPGRALEPSHILALVLTGIGAGIRWAAPSWRAVSDTEEHNRSQAKESLETALAVDHLRAELERTAAALSHQTAHSQALAAMARTLNLPLAREEMLSRMLGVIEQQFGVPAGIYLVEGDGGSLALAALSAVESEVIQRQPTVPVDERTAIGWCAARGQARIIDDISDALMLPSGVLAEARSEAVAPLTSRGEIMGVLCLASAEPGSLRYLDEPMLVTFAEQVASGIASYRAIEQVHMAQRTLDEVQRRYVREVWQEYVPAAPGYRWQGGEISTLSHIPLSGCAEVFHTGQTVGVLGDDLVAPVSFGGEVLGALGVSDPTRRHAWTDEEIEFVESVAAQMGMVMQNVRLIDEARSRLTELMALHKQYLGEGWEEFVSTKAQVEFTFTQPGIAPEAEAPRQLDQVASRREPLVWSESTDESQAVGMGTPIVLRDHVYGALGLLEEGEEREWSEDDLAIVNAVTDRMAIAIENARLFTETRRRAVELEQTAQRLREVDRFRAEFLANMSHELRTPLNSIIGFSRVILKGIDGPLTDMQRTDLEAIYNNGQSLLHLINDVLDMSKIDAGMMELVIESVDLAAVIERVRSSSAVLVKDKPIALRLEIEPDLPVIHADGTRVKQVITNLVSNAAKFTEEGSITVRAWHEGEMVYVSVSDTGIGVPEDKMPLLFEQFRQIDSSSTRRAEGTGLGLPISKHFVEMHGGHIWAESEVGVGSVFTFSLPIEGPVDQVPELAGLELDQGKKTVLVIERDEDEFALYRDWLEGNGYQTVPLYDGQQAIRWARFLKPWAVVMDLDLRDGQGWEALQALRTNRATRGLPVIVCSALQEEGKAVSLGAGAYLPKPIAPQQLLETLSRLER